jgi:hypothetical protein
MITASLQSVSAEVTKVLVESDIKLTGKVAQFGRLGVIRDTSEKLMTDFAHSLNTMLDAEGETPAAAAAAPVEPEAAAETADATEAAPAAEEPTVRKIQGPAAEPIELSEVAGGAVLKRLLPLLGGLVLLLVIMRRMRK